MVLASQKISLLARVALASVALLLTLSGCTTTSMKAPSTPTKQPARPEEARTFRPAASQPAGYHYLLFLPANYKKSAKQPWPVLVFLHGAGERGTDLNQVAVHGAPKVARTQPDFPFILVAPQCPPDETWSPAIVMALVDEILATYRADRSRVYLTGMSMGGYGTWTTATKFPERFAAIAPVCGGGDVLEVLLSYGAKRDALRSLPVWAFHGAKDDVVPWSESERMVNAYKNAGVRDLQFTIYPEANHDSWSETYANPKLYAWLLAHRR